MAISGNAIAQVVECVLKGGATKATKFIGPTQVIKATRHGKARKGERTTQMVVTVGRPNYAEREFISRCRKAGEPFPVKKIQLKFPKAK